MKRVLVIGSPGAGKSTFARRLRERTGLPLYYLDQIWHCSDGSHLSEKEFDDRLDELLKQERWIIDGNYSRTLVRRLAACDTEQEFDAEFKQHIINFPQKRLPQIYQLLQSIREEKAVIIFKTREEADNYLKKEQETD